MVCEQIAECALGNVISVWETLSVERARRAILNNEVNYVVHAHYGIKTKICYSIIGCL